MSVECVAEEESGMCEGSIIQGLHGVESWILGHVQSSTERFKQEKIVRLKLSSKDPSAFWRGDGREMEMKAKEH